MGELVMRRAGGPVLRRAGPATALGQRQRTRWPAESYRARRGAHVLPLRRVASRKHHPHPSADRGQPGDLWKRLLRPAKQPAPLTAAAFVAELNRRYAADACYRPEACFVVVAAAARGGPPRGASWQGPEALKPVMLRIVAATSADYESDTPFFADP